MNKGVPKFDTQHLKVPRSTQREVPTEPKKMRIYKIESCPYSHSQVKNSTHIFPRAPTNNYSTILNNT